MDTRFGYEGILFGCAIPPKLAATGTLTSDGIDRSGYQGDAVFTVSHGVAVGRPSAFSVNAHVEESDTYGSNYTDVDLAADVDEGDDAITEMNDDSSTYGIEVLRVKLENRKKYLRLVCVIVCTGGTGIPVQSTYALTGARELPVTQPVS